ncbi:hypothetical protein HFP57_06825 [Parasphingopyxis algicola]|uniref:hypothetical protein n=1 Tax=Parasphingopyxis algicola TaxID=2026624 RepID=UPI0015A06B6A|nr:hypothetical protein [Parasphingopyxis algicola]QLC24769.1 hypothetical protein HFP57_06825 [Parasphingopyxis algicola]
MGLLHSHSFDTGCRIEVEQSEEYFHAHVELDGDVPIGPGDRVRVHGDPISIPFGGSAVFERTATVERARPLARAWIRFASYFDLAELYEVSFTPRRLR